MLSIDNILETNQMIHDNKLDVRTITMGISLLECASSSGKELCDRIYDRITKEAEHLVVRILSASLVFLSLTNASL